MEIVQWLSENWMLIGTVLFGISEALASIPVVRANSVFQLIYQFLERFKKQPVA